MHASSRLDVSAVWWCAVANSSEKQPYSEDGAVELLLNIQEGKEQCVEFVQCQVSVQKFRENKELAVVCCL